MSSSIASTLILVFIFSISLQFSEANTISPSTLIENICSSTKKFDIKYKLCMKTLQREPRVASTTNLFDLSIEIMKSGISRSTHVHKYMESLLKRSGTNPKMKGALQDCKLAYDLVIGSFKSALGEVEERDYQTATYDLLIGSTDDVHMCERAVASGGIKDEIILRGNKIVPIYGLSAFEAVGQLDLHN